MTELRPVGPGTVAQPLPHGMARLTRHVGSLDALRGIAALTVVFHHLGLAYASRIHADLASSPLWWMVDHAGHSSVIIFFVLSGYVLQSSYAATVDFTYSSYLLKRLFRIYPALIVALAAAWALYASAGIPAVEGLTLVDLARHVALLCLRTNDIALDMPIWSLAYEVRFSLVFPLMAWAVVRRPVLAAAAMLVVYTAAAVMLWNGDGFLILGYGAVTASIITAYYLICFSIGMIGCRYLSGQALRAPHPAVEAVLVSGFVAVLLAVRNELIGSLAGIGLIALCVTPGSVLGRALRTPMLLWLGLISYSLYLLHVIVLSAVLASPIDNLPFAAVAATVVVLSLAASAASYRLVERPGIALGRRVAGSLALRERFSTGSS